MPPISIAAVVVTFNRKALLKECLISLRRQIYPLSSIIVVDNASGDGTDALVKELSLLPGTPVEYIRLPENCGGAGGFSAGMRHAYERGFAWVWVMDDDAEPQDDCLQQLAGHVATTGGNTPATPVLTTEDGKVLVQHRGNINFKTLLGGGTIIPATADRTDGIAVPITHSSFVGLLLPHSAMAKAGFPDPSFFIFFDDVDYCARLSRFTHIDLIPSGVMRDKGAATAYHGRKAGRRFRYSVPIRDYWKSYYSCRNHIHIALKYQTGRWRLPLALFSYLTRSLLRVFLLEDHKCIRWALILTAFFDGISGRMGKRIDPVRWQARFNGVPQW